MPFDERPLQHEPVTEGQAQITGHGRASLGTLIELSQDYEPGTASIFKWADYQAQRSAMQPVEGYDPFNDIAGYEDHAHAFVDSDSPAETALVKRRIDEENDARRRLSEAGLAGVLASLASGMLDPINYIPIGVGAASITRGGRIAQAIFQGARAGAISGIATEGIGQATLETRTAQESIESIAAQALLGGALGGAGGLAVELGTLVGGLGGVRAAARRAVTEGSRLPLDSVRGRLETDLRSPVSPEVGTTIDGEMIDTAGRSDRELASVGAAEVPPANPGGERVVGALGSEYLERAPIIGTPLGVAAKADTEEAMRLMGTLVEVPYMLRKVQGNVAMEQAVETLAGEQMAQAALAVRGLREAFLKMRGITGPFPLIRAEIQDASKAQGRMTWTEFNTQVARALRRNDESNIPEVAAAAKQVRKDFFDPIKERAIQLGLLDEDVDPKTADSYLTRLYDDAKIRSRPGEFMNRLVDYFRGQRESASERLQEALAQQDQTKQAIADIAVALGVQQKAKEAGEGIKATLDEETRRETKKALGLLRREATQANQDVVATRAKSAAAGKEANRFLRAYNRAVDIGRKAQERVDEWSQEGADLSGASTYLKGLLRDVRKGGATAPKSLAQFVRQQGYLIDFRGEVAKIDSKLLRKGGVSLDEMTQRAADAGYLATTQGDRPTIEDFLAALDSDTRGQKVYSGLDREALDRMEEVGAFAENLRSHKLDPAEMSDDQIAIALARGNDKAANIPVERAYQRAALNEAKRARTVWKREAETRRAEVTRAADRMRKAEAEFDKAKAKAADVGGLYKAQNKAFTQNAAKQDRLSARIRTLQDLATADDSELSDISRQVMENILHFRGAPPSFLEPSQAKYLMDRTLLIKDEAIEDFLVNDLRVVLPEYARTMGPALALHEKFGTMQADEALEDARIAFDGLRNKAETESDNRRLMKQQQEFETAFRGAWDRVRGVYELPENPDSLLYRAGQVVRTWNYVRLLGGQVISSLPDPANIMMAAGVSRFMKGIGGLITGAKALRSVGPELHKAAVAIDLISHDRAMLMADALNPYGRQTKFERAVRGIGDRFGLVSLQAQWNTAWEQFAGLLSIDKILTTAEKEAAGTATPPESQYLRFLGLTPGYTKLIADRFAKSGQSMDGLRIIDTSEWTDGLGVELRRSLHAAVRKDVHRQIIRPTAGDRPLWMSTPLGQVVGQFKSFNAAAQSKILIAGLQRRDAATFSGLALATTLGMMSYAIKSALAGRDVSDDPRQWLLEGVDRSGTTGWLMEANNTVEKITRGTIGLGRLAGKEPLTRYASRNLSDVLAGPTAGLIEDIAMPIGAAMTGDFTRRDLHRLRRLMPWQNMFYLSKGADAIERASAQTLGLEPM
ncbi:MAG: hypothetical protein ACRC67_09545 [Inquilinus sp.]|uniref:hypothetical protein n=1 Tax=Inquilinus sp. TaxID=1932117 RepID=UPI003F3AD633